MMDGCLIPCVAYTDPDIQNAYLEGFTNGNKVTNLFHGRSGER